MKNIILIFTTLIFSFGYSQIPTQYIPEIPESKLDASAQSKLNSAGTGNSNILAITDLTSLQNATANKIWSIQSNIDLAITTLNIPSGVTLKFEGGKITNGTLSCATNDCIIKASPFDDILGTDVVLTGVIADKIYPEWFGAIGDGLITTDNREELQAAIDFAENNGELIIKGGKYYVSVFDENVTSGSITGALVVHSNTIIDFVNGSGWSVIPNLFTEYTFVSIQEADNVTIMSSDRTGFLQGDFLGDKLNTPSEDGNTLKTVWRCTNIVIDGMEFLDSYGDGVANQQYSGFQQDPQGMEQGTINFTTGVYEASTEHIRDITRWDLTLSKYESPWGRDTDFARHNEFHVRGGAYGGFVGVEDGILSIFFYDVNGDFIEVFEDVEMYDRIKFPSNATECALLVKQGDPTGVSPKVQASEITVGLTIKNCHFHDGSRNHISGTGVQHLNIHDNIIETAKGTLPMAGVDIEDFHQGNKYINIHDNVFRYNGNYDIVFVGSWKVRIFNNEFTEKKSPLQLATVGFGSDCVDIHIKNNDFYHGTCYTDPASVYVDNNFNYNKVIITNGELINNRFTDCVIDAKADDDLLYPLLMDGAYIDGGVFTTRTRTAKRTIRNLTMRNIAGTCSWEGGANTLMENININTIGSGYVQIKTENVNNLTTNGYLEIWKSPSANGTTYKGWTLNGADSYILSRSNANPLGHFIFKNLTIETERIATSNPAISIAENLGSLIIRDSHISDKTATNGNVISFDETVSKVRLINSEIETGSGVNLLDKGTSVEDATWLYKNNIFTGVNLNNTLGTEMNNLEE